MFVAPIEGDKLTAVAEKAGFSVSESLHSVRIEGPDTPGLGAKITSALANAGINLRGISAAALGSQMVCYFGARFDRRRPQGHRPTEEALS